MAGVVSRNRKGIMKGGSPSPRASRGSLGGTFIPVFVLGGTAAQERIRRPRLKTHYQQSQTKPHSAKKIDRPGKQNIFPHKICLAQQSEDKFKNRKFLVVLLWRFIKLIRLTVRFYIWSFALILRGLLISDHQVNQEAVQSYRCIGFGLPEERQITAAGR